MSTKNMIANNMTREMPDVENILFKNINNVSPEKGIRWEGRKEVTGLIQI